MKRLGSLYDFIQAQPNLIIRQNKLSKLNDLQANNDRTQRMKRIKTTLDQYQASNKKLFIKHLDRNAGREQNIDQWQHLFEKYKEKKFYLKNNALLLPRKTQIIQIKSKERINMNHGLLRALSKLQSSDLENSQHQIRQDQKSFANYTQKLKNLSKVPLVHHLKSQNLQAERIGRTNYAFRVKGIRTKSSLSDTKRIQFQRCLSWAKKHHKVGKYYQKQLGKQKRSNTWNAQQKTRKRILESLSQKYKTKLKQDHSARSQKF